jgi:RNA polymerase sigma-70 factor (family 1)
MKIVYSDTELLYGFQKGDEQAIKELYNRHYQPLCFFADRLLDNKEEAEDVAVESFLKLLKEREKQTTIRNIKAYLFSAAYNGCVDILRRRKTRQKVYNEIEHVGVGAGAGIAEELPADRERIIASVLQVIYEEIEQLPAKTKIVFTSIFLEGKSTATIAAEMGISPQTVLNQKSRALEILRTKLYEQGYQESGLLLYCLLLLSTAVEA